MLELHSEDRSIRFDEVICPFCGLLCDDLSIDKTPNRITVSTNGCSIAERRYHAACHAPNLTPEINGQSVEQSRALDEAAKLIAASRAPIIAGMLTDVEGSRAALQLADRIGAIIDHQANKAYSINATRIQTYGGIFVTLTETRNRADVVVLFGSSLHQTFPRLLDRLNASESLLHGSQLERTLVFVGPKSEGFKQLPSNTIHIDCAMEQTGAFLSAMRGAVEDRLTPELPSDMDETFHIDELAKLILEADYPVFAWSASDFEFPTGDLAVDSILRLIDSLNVKFRAAGLTLSRFSSTGSVNQVATWQCGKPTPLSFRSGAPEYRPNHFSVESVLNRNDADLIVWVGGLEEEVQIPDSQATTIVISATRPDKADVFIPVSVPGVHHNSHQFRTDNIVSLYLKSAIDSDLSSGAEALRAILSRLEAS